MGLLELILAHLNSNYQKSLCMCDEYFLCCDCFPMPVRVDSLRAEERVNLRQFIVSEVPAKNGVLVPGTSQGTLCLGTRNPPASLTLRSWKCQKEKERGPGVGNVSEEWLPSLRSG